MNRRGRLAPTPTGFLHVGHAYTFGIAAMRAAGELVFRVDDLDYTRCTDEYIAAAIDDLQWLGLTWAEGPDCGGESGPYFQSQRTESYLQAWQKWLLKKSFIQALILGAMWKTLRWPHMHLLEQNRCFR